MIKLALAVAILFFGGWQLVWNVAPTDTLQLALQGNIINGSKLTSNEALMVEMVQPNDQTAEALIGDYFVSSNGLGILVNDHYYGGEIINRFFKSTALAWFAFFFALGVLGIRFFFFI
jgi:hypothetical protein